MVSLIEIEFGIFALRKEFIKRNQFVEKVKRYFAATVFISITTILIIW